MSKRRSEQDKKVFNYPLRIHELDSNTKKYVISTDFGAGDDNGVQVVWEMRKNGVWKLIKEIRF